MNTYYLSKHQINRNIFFNIYGKYPVNPTYNKDVKAKFDIIRKQTTRTLEIFSKLFNFYYESYDNVTSHQYAHPCISHNIEHSIATLVIIEVTYRFLESSRKLNTQRTKIAGYIINKQWNKLSTDSIGIFFCPFFDVLIDTYPKFVDEFKNITLINEEIYYYINELRRLI